MNGSGKQSFYEIQLSNGSLIAAFLVAAGVGVAVFVLGVMVGRGQAQAPLPESGWVEPLGVEEIDPEGEMTEAAPVATEQEDLSAEPAEPFTDVVAETGGDDETAQPSASAAPAGLPTNDPALASGWVIQVKATDNEAEADGLQATLSRAGYPAFVVSAEVDGGTTWRVRVGRYGSRDDADRVADALSGRDDVSGTWVTQG